MAITNYNIDNYENLVIIGDLIEKVSSNRRSTEKYQYYKNNIKKIKFLITLMIVKKMYLCTDPLDAYFVLIKVWIL